MIKPDNSLYYSFFASGDFCHLLITFANSLDPDQDRKNVGPDLDPNSQNKSAEDNKSMENYPACKKLIK